MLIKASSRLRSHSKRERKNADPSPASHKDDNDMFDSEKEYIEKLETYAIQLKQLRDRTHPEFCKASKRIESWLADQKLRNQILHDYKIDAIHNQYEREIRTCDRDCGIEKKKIQEYLIGLCEDLKRRLEHDKRGIELTTTGDVLELKPMVTRKLRRRAPEVPSSFVNSSIIGGRFDYWSDLHLCSPTWPVSALNTSSKGSVELPPSPCLTISTAQENIDDSLSHSIISSASTFGSLGVNVEDGGSLLTHLIASIGASNAMGNGHVDSGALSSSGVLFTQSALANSLGYVGAAGSSPFTVTSVTPSIVPGLTGVQPPKRRKQQNVTPLTQLSLLLPENDIYSDLTIIHRTCGKPPSSGGSKKHGHEAGSVGGSARCGTGSSSPLTAGGRAEEALSVRRVDTTESSSREQHRHHHYHHRHQHSRSREGDSNSPLIWIDDGRLYVGQSCYQQGTPVFLESHGCNGTVVAVGTQDVSIKRSSDTGIMRITVHQLKLGRYVLAPLKPR